MKQAHKITGFTLPTVLVLSLTILIVMVVLITATSASYKGSEIDYSQKLADEAAEAGTASATACLTLSSHIQTWGAVAGQPNLTPNTDCNGANTYSSNTHVYSDTSVRTSYVVGDLDYSYPFAAQISSLGTAEVLRPDGTVSKTYTSVRKKVITWPTEITAQASASGTNRTCAIVNYQVYCWGYNRFGQLGDGRYEGMGPTSQVEEPSSIDSLVPVKVYQGPGVMAGKKIVKIFVAQYHSCALSEDGLMYCWGYNSSGQIGRGNTTDAPTPVQVGGALAGKTITDIGGTHNLSCAIADSKIYCWGTNLNGLTGRNVTGGSTTSPTLVLAQNNATSLPTNYTATKLATSGSRSRLMCAIANGKAYCWGQNDTGAVGDNSTTQRYFPTKVYDSGLLAGKTVTEISQEGSSNSTDGYAHVCAIASGSLYCWGENKDGQLGNNSTTDSSIPVAVVANGALNGKTLQDIKLGIYTSCALASNGVYCWGKNNYGQVGDGTNTTRQSPVPVALQSGMLTSSNVISIGAGANRGCAIINDGRSFCWGLNNTGQIGDGTLINRNTPTESLFLRPSGNQYIF